MPKYNSNSKQLLWLLVSIVVLNLTLLSWYFFPKYPSNTQSEAAWVQVNDKATTLTTPNVTPSIRTTPIPTPSVMSGVIVQANTVCPNTADIVNRSFDEYELSTVWKSTRPPENFDAYTTRIWKNQLQEIVIANQNVWLRTGDSTTFNSIVNKNWSVYPLTQVWRDVINRPPLTGINTFAYRKYNSKIQEIIISGNRVWYRQENTAGQYDFPKRFEVTTLSSFYAGLTNGPDFSRTSNTLDELSYRMLDGKLVEIAIQGENVYIRSSTNDDAINLGSSWTINNFRNSWQYIANENIFPVTNLQYVSDNGKLSELFIKNSKMYRRTCATDDELILGYSKAMLDKYIRIYSDNTNYSQLINGPYNNKHAYSQAHRIISATGIAHLARYQYEKYLNPNLTSSPDKTKAINYLKTSIDKYFLSSNNSTQPESWQQSWGQVLFSNIVTRDLLLMYMFLGNDLSQDYKDKMRRIVEYETAYYKAVFDNGVTAYRNQDFGERSPYYAISGNGSENNAWRRGNTVAEENGASAELFAFAYAVYRDENYNYYAKCYGYHTITVPNPVDGDSNTYCNVRTQTVYDNFDVHNHNYKPSVSYTISLIASLQQAEFGYRLKNLTPPPELRHNQVPLWNKLTTFYYPFYTGKDNVFKIYSQFYPGLDWGFMDVRLLAPEVSFVRYFGGGKAGLDYVDLEKKIIPYFADRTAKNSETLIPEPFRQSGAVINMPAYETYRQVQKTDENGNLIYDPDGNPVMITVADQNITARNAFVNGLTMGKGAGESILYRLKALGQL